MKQITRKERKMTRRLSIGAYCGPRRGTKAYPTDWRRDEEFARYRALGFDFVLSEYDAVYGKNYDGNGNESLAEDFTGSDLCRYMELANRHGIDVIVESHVLNEVLWGKQSLKAAGPQLTAMLSDLGSVENFKGLMMADEPGISSLSKYRAAAEFLRTQDGMQGKELFTSLLPMYANLTVEIENSSSYREEENYLHYLKGFGSCLGRIDYDFYPFDAKTIRKEYLKNLELAAVAAQGKLDCGVTVQSMAVRYKRTGEIGCRVMDKKSYYTYQLYCALAYGMKRITYFTYWDHWGSADSKTEEIYHAMIHGDGSTNTEVYPLVKEANEEIRSMEQEYLDFNWQGTMKLTGTDRAGLLAGLPDYRDPHIQEAAADQDTIIGCLKDSKGRSGYVLVNVTDPADDTSSRVNITFANAQNAVVYVQGKKREEALLHGTYTAALPPGAGMFILPDCKRT